METMQGSHTQQAAYLIFDMEISQQTVEKLLEALAVFASNRIRSVHLALSTSGGDVTQGITLYNSLLAMPFELTTHNIGNVDSIGNAVFLAGRKRYASAHSTFMFHSVYWNIVQPMQLQLKGALEIADSIRRENSRIASIIGDRTKLKGPDVEQLFADGDTKDAKAALTSGIIDGIKDFQIVEGAPVIKIGR